MRRSANSIFNCHNPKALEFITQLHLCLSHSRYHKFKHNFQDSLNPVCNYALTQSAKRHLRDVLKMSYEVTQDISARCLSDT